MAKIPPYLHMSMKYFRNMGYICDKTEQKIGSPMQKFLTSRDLFGLMDALAFSPDSAGVVGVQSTSHGGLSSHKKKYRQPEQHQMLVNWLRGYPTRRYIMLGWKKVNNRWGPTVYEAVPNGKDGYTWQIEVDR